LSPDAKTILNNPIGYTPDEADYKAFLDCGLEIFEMP
jgi:thiol:disulfide interchange protein DsbD